MSAGDLLIGLGGPIVAAAAVILNGWWAKRGGKRAAEIERSSAASADWARYSAEIREWTSERIATLQADLDRERKRVNTLEARQDEIQDAFRALSRKYQAALRAIRTILRMSDADLIEHLPREIVDDL